MNTTPSVQSTLVPSLNRVSVTAALFGHLFSIRLEPTIYAMAARLAGSYTGGYWDFYMLSNGGFYMAPAEQAKFDVVSDNGFAGTLSGDALGITVCMYAYSHLSFAHDPFASLCASQFYRLREYVMEHAEAAVMLRVLD